MNKRPKSREETPKEGSDSTRSYRIAAICGRAAQKARGPGSFPAQNSRIMHTCNTKYCVILSVAYLEFLEVNKAALGSLSIS